MLAFAIKDYHMRFGSVPGGLLNSCGHGCSNLLAALVAVGISAKKLQVRSFPMEYPDSLVAVSQGCSFSDRSGRQRLAFTLRMAHLC